MSAQQEVRKFIFKNMAEREGFEPSVRITYNGFRDRPIRPLWHLSFLQNIQDNVSTPEGSSFPRNFPSLVIDTPS